MTACKPHLNFPFSSIQTQAKHTDTSIRIGVIPVTSVTTSARHGRVRSISRTSSPTATSVSTPASAPWVASNTTHPLSSHTHSNALNATTEVYMTSQYSLRLEITSQHFVYRKLQKPGKIQCISIHYLS